MDPLIVWRTYLVAQVAQAGLGLISPEIDAIALEVKGDHVRLIFVASKFTERVNEQIDELVEEFSVLVGPAVTYEVIRETGTRSDVADDRVWTYVAHR